MNAIEKTMMTLSVLAVLFPLFGWLTARHLRRNAIRRSVFADLDNARESGYFVPGEYLDEVMPIAVACDLVAWHHEWLDHDPRILEPYVREWMISKGML